MNVNLAMALPLSLRFRKHKGGHKKFFLGVVTCGAVSKCVLALMYTSYPLLYRVNGFYTFSLNVHIG